MPRTRRGSRWGGVVSAFVRIAGVDIPWELIEAQRDDRLVLFVGAGASRAAPSSLPDFRQLTGRIAADSGLTPTPAQLDDPDVFLGDLMDGHGVDVHQRVADLIGSASSLPNSLHGAIAELAAASPRVRMVTTNYDLHLSKALTAQGSTFTEEAAPALPMGDDFTGVVYLHGRLGRPVRHLVVTDTDFGQAYLRDAWATRFLERMFSQYTVLFIGYSHNDSIVSYLGRGLRADSARFVLTDDPHSAHWRRLRIKPISYPNTDHSHQALTDAIRGWASWASMGLLDHRQQVAGLLATVPSLIPEENSYLEAVVADSDTVKFFAEYARDLAWLSWITSRSEFMQLFDADAESSPCSRVLAAWFSEHYVMNEKLSDDAWSVMSQAGGRLSSDLWDAIGRALQRLPHDRPGWMGRWLMLMTETAPKGCVPWLEYALMKSAWPDDRMIALLLFEHLTRPLTALRPSFARGSRTEIALGGERYWLNEAWAKIFTPNLADGASELIAIADRHLRRAHALLKAAGSASPAWDPLSFSRSAIEPHTQDNMPEQADPLIDAGRDCLEYLLDNEPETGQAYLHLWANAEAPLLRRLAVHGWTYRSDVGPTAKLKWLRSRGWLFDHMLRHEVFVLIAANIAAASATVANALVSDAAAGPSGSQHREYEALNALAWIARRRPKLPSVRAALAASKSRNPNFAERSHPDLMIWTDFSWALPQLSMKPADLRVMVDDDPAKAIAELKNRTSLPEGPGWDEALSLISDTVRAWPDSGIPLYAAASSAFSDICSAVIQGWGGATADDSTANRILDSLNRADLSTLHGAVARMLAGVGQTEAKSTPWQRFAAARLLARRIWNLIPSASTPAGIDNWLGHAISHPAGQLATFWVRACSSDWQGSGDAWAGLPDLTREQLEAMLGGSDDRTAMAEIIFASQVYFLHAADPDWCLANVLPLLDWAQQDRARRTWDGFLIWGRFNSELLARGLRDQYVQTAIRAEALTDQLARQLSLHLAAVALSSPGTATLAWARKLTASSSLSVRVAWLNQIAWQLSTAPVDAAEQHWRDWIQEYWQGRLASIPSRLTSEESSAMSEWIVCLTSSFEEAVDLAIKVPAEMQKHSRLLHELTNDRIASHTSAVAKIVAHLLRETSPPLYHCDELRRITQFLAGGAPLPELDTIRGQALRLGCYDAADW